MRAPSAIFLCLMVCGCTAAPVAGRGEQSVLVKARVLFRDSEGHQPKWECPESTDPKVETICLFGPVSFTVDVRDVLIGHGLPRRVHAILWIDPEPSHEVDLYLAGTRSPTGEISVRRWGAFERVGCQPPDFLSDLHAEEEVKGLRQAGRLPCIEN
jgi:hypothetical protein